MRELKSFRKGEEIINYYNIYIYFLKYTEWSQSAYTRVVYDRVRKRKNYFEIPAFLQIEVENQERENSKHQMKIKTKTFLVLFSFDFEFPALHFPRSI